MANTCGWAPLLTPAFNEARIGADVAYLASPALEGRATGTPGVEAALVYVEDLFSTMGLVPAGDQPGSYRQAFPFVKTEHLSAPTLSFDGTPVSAEEFVASYYSGSGQVSAEVVFVGYGLVVPPFDRADYPDCPYDPAGFDEYAGVDLQGKIALINTKCTLYDAAEWEKCPYPPELMEPYGMLPKSDFQFDLAREHGAAAVIAWRPEFAWTTLYVPQPIGGRPEFADLGMPLMLVKPSVLHSLLPQLATWISQIDATRLPQSRALSLVASIQVEQQVTHTEAYNLVGEIPGADPVIGDEVVLVGGHIDHMGIFEDTGVFFPGATDNASGAVAVVRLAEQVAALGSPPARTLRVVAWNAEEMGLYGSCDYALNVLPDPSNVVAVINIDGFCTGDGTELVFHSDSSSQWLLVLLRAVNLRLGTGMYIGSLALEPNSDHKCFGDRGIPAARFSSSPMSCPYCHTPEDDAAHCPASTLVGLMEGAWGLIETLLLGIEDQI